MGMILTAEAIEKDLPTTRVGKTCIVYDRVESTNDVLRAVMSDERYDGLAVFADHQTKGRGRNGRSWQAVPGSSILCSVLLAFEGKLSELTGPINLAAAIAAAASLNNCFSIGAMIKWPNDTYAAGRKLGGILIESAQIDRQRAAFVVGIGINVTQRAEDLPAELAEIAASVAMIVDCKIDQSDRLVLARQLLIELDHAVEQVAAGDYDQLRTDWLALAANRNRPVRVEHGGRQFQARTIDIDHRDNSLLVQDEAGMIWHLTPNLSRLIQ